jgi:hypothetical protein
VLLFVVLDDEPVLWRQEPELLQKSPDTSKLETTSHLAQGINLKTLISTRSLES